ncbi:MAG: hypothetical protein AB8G05_10905 [Oligoflexales bacterium]
MIKLVEVTYIGNVCFFQEKHIKLQSKLYASRKKPVSSISIDVLLRWVFLSAIFLKLTIYSMMTIKIHKKIGLNKIQDLLNNYLKIEHFLSSAWRLGTFIALLLSYSYFYFYFKVKSSPSITSLWNQGNYLALTIIALILIVILRSMLQSIADWFDCEQSIRRLKRVATTKKILGGISHATNILMWTQPLMALKWSALSSWSMKMITVGKFVTISEKWVDKKIQKKVGQYIGTIILATLIESLIKISLIVSLHFFLKI